MNHLEAHAGRILISRHASPYPPRVLKREEAQEALVCLLRVRTWKDLFLFADRFFACGLPWYSPSLSSYLLEEDPAETLSEAERLSGNAGNARFDLGLDDARKKVEELLPIAQAVQFAREDSSDGAGKRFSAALDLLEERARKHEVIDIEEILMERDLLREALTLYSEITSHAPRKLIDERFSETDLGSGLTKVECSWDWLASEHGRLLDEKQREFGAGHLLFDGSIPLGDAITMGVGLDESTIPNRSFYLHDARNPRHGPDPAVYAARKTVAFLINGHLNGRFGRYSFPQMSADLHLDELDDVNPLVAQLWHEVTLLIDEGAAIGLCAHCGRPLQPKSRSAFCGPSCKTSATNRRRTQAQELFAAGVSLEEATRIIGQKHASSISRWYDEARMRSPS